jgi:hypothetical protein
MISFDQIASAYRYVVRNGKSDPNFAKYMSKFKENIFKTIYAKIEDLFKQRPDTPIALLCATTKAPGHYVIIKGTTTDGRLIVGNLVEASQDETDMVRDSYWDADRLLGNLDNENQPAITMTWLEKFDANKAKEIENTCDTYGAKYDKKGQLQNTVEAEEHSLQKDKTNMLHVKGVALDVKNEHKGKMGNLYRQQIYVPKKYNTQIKNKK